MASKFYFDLKKAAIYGAVKWERHPVFRLAKLLKKPFLVLFIFFFLIFLYGFFTEAFTPSTLSLGLGLSLIFLTLFLGCSLKLAFLNSKLKNPKIKATDNLAEFLSFEAAKAVSEGLIHTENPELNFIFSRALLNIKEIKIPQDLEKVIPEALNIAKTKGHQRIEIGDMLIGLAKFDPVFQKILIEAGLKVEDIENLVWWYESLEQRFKEAKKWWEYKNLLKLGTIGKEWTAGYTITLDQYSTDWTAIIKKKGFPEVIGHQKELAAVERILARREKNNVLLVGESGTGRKSVIQALAVKSALGQSLPEINYKRLVELDLSALKEVEPTLDAIFREVISAGNIILIIDEFHNYVGGRAQQPGIIDISGILSSFLHLPQFQIIAITSFLGLHKYIEQNPSILAQFGKVEVSEISVEETLMILENLALTLERKHKRFVTYPALRDIIKYCARYIPAKPFPEKAMEILDEVIVYVVSSTKDKMVLPKHVARIVSEKVEVPVGEIEIKEKEILLNLENLIHQRIINQEEAVREISAALRRARAEVAVRKGPMGTFLFLGPTGVGKTEASKALAHFYFGSEERMIRLDMSEFQNIGDIPRLIGSPGEEGLLTTQVREAPFSLILLDEIEKAHPNILNLFLQVLDEGHLTDGLGRKVDFKNTIIIATSNAGYKIILEALRLKTEWSQVKQKLLDYLFEKAIFRPEFINRFDAVVVFCPLSKENLLDIAELMLQKLKKNLKEKGIEFVITMPLKERIVELGYSPTFGAREMRRVIQDKVENVLASALLSGELKRGDKIEIEAEEFKLKKL